jgi:hypothetical protein
MLRKSPLTRNKPLAAKRVIARAKPLQVRRRKPAKSAAEKRHMDRVAAMGCLVSGKPATLHHVSATIHGGRIARSHKRVVPLAPEYHLIQHGPKTSVEALGHGGFFTTYGIDLLAVADRLWAESEALNA